MLTHWLQQRWLIALISGALTPLALAPVNLWPLALLTPAGLYYALSQQPNRGFGLGWLFGIGLYGAGASWVYVSIHTYGDTPALLAALMTAAFVVAIGLFFALQGWCFSRFFAHKKHPMLAFIGLWIVFEWLRSWFLTGFPWLYLGYSLTDTPFSDLASIGGVWLLSLLVLCISLLLLQLVSAPQQRKQSAALLSICLLSALPTLQWTHSKGEQAIDIVQANIPQNLKWNREYLPDFLARYRTLTQEQTQASVVIWPETAIPALMRHAFPYLDTLLENFDQNGRILISGVPALEPDQQHPNGYRAHNSLAVLTQTPNIYHKQRLVPFGEYVPFEAQLRGLIAFFNLPMSGFSLPAEPQGHLQVGTQQVAAAICYEIAYPELVRSSALNSDWILTVSNDTWFSHSLAPAQHLQIARMRAIENGRWVVRSTNNGRTALISPNGTLTTQIPPYQTAVLSGTIELMNGTTPYQHLGVAPVLLLSLLMLGLGTRKR